MGEMAEVLNAMRQHKKHSRANNTVKRTELLKSHGIKFESKNNGAHLILEHRFDFWPSTGLWIDRETKKRGGGIPRLLDIMRKFK